MSKMGLEEQAQTATHPLKAGQGKDDMSKMGFNKQAQMATHSLKAGWGRRWYEQDAIGEAGTQLTL